MGESGEDIHMSPAARRLIPLSIECKNHHKFHCGCIMKVFDSKNDEENDEVIPCPMCRTEINIIQYEQSCNLEE